MSGQIQGRFRAAFITMLVATSFAAAGLASAGVARGDGAQEQPETVPGQLVVGFAPHTPRTQERVAVSDAGGSIVERVPSIDGAVVSVDQSDADSATKTLSEDDAVSFVEPNYIVKVGRIPNDSSFADQWSLRNTGQLGGKVGADISATSAWDVTTGSSVVVAVVDTGIDYSHPDLKANIWTNPGDPVNGNDDDVDGFADDTHGADFINQDSDPNDDAGHGTHVAGVIGAEGANGIGVAGVAWNVRLMAVKFLDQNGEGNTADAANAIDYAVSHGAKIINASWGGPAFSQTLYDAVRRASDKGVLFMAAAGNEGENSDVHPDYPAAFDLPNVISVAASDRYDKLPPYSNYGASSVDLAAPGDDIYSTVPPATDPSGYATFSGTSMATPAVSGAAALYLSRWPQNSVDQTRNAILQSVDKDSAFAGRTATGGRLNVARALGVQPSSNPAPDRTPPSPFVLLGPRNGHATARRGLHFHWQRSTDVSGIEYYKVYVDGRGAKTIRDPDGPGGRDPNTNAYLRLRSGGHRWFVRAYDYAGNERKSRISKRAARSSRSLYIGKRYR